jgi:hypothetical protein
VDETVRRIAALPEEGAGQHLREEIHTLRVQLVPLLQGTKAPKRKERKGEAVSPKDAEAIMGKDHFFGIEAVRKAFPGITLKPEQIPPIPFSKDDLERAKELGDSLRLRTDKAPGKGKLNMQKMQELLQPVFEQSGEGKVLYDTDWYENEDFFTEAPELCWVLTSDGVIPDSEDKDYLEQTEHIAQYLRDTVYQGKKLPQQYIEAIKELDEQKDDIRQLIDDDNWEEAAKRLADLKLNKLTRRIPAEVLYDMLVSFQNGGKRHLEDMYDWTCIRSSDGDLVYVGRFARGGVGVYGGLPGYSDGSLGVVLARKF